MNSKKISPDDPRLTAYALGELTGEELAAVEAAVRDDPVARAAVEEIRAVAAQLEAALASEPLPSVRREPSLARAAILPGRDPSKLDGGDGERPAGKVLQFPRALVVFGGLAAACLVLVFTLRHKPAVTSTPVAQEATRAKTEAKEGLAKESAVVAHAPRAADIVSPPPAIDVLDQARNSIVQAPPVEPLNIPAPVPTVPEARREERAAATVATAQPIAARDPVADALPAAKPVVPPAEPRLAVAQPAAPPPKSLAPLPAARSIASADGRIPVSENRGLMSFVPKVDFGTIAPRYPALPADARERDNDFVSVAQQPVASFAIEADTAGYADVRQFLQQRQRPPREAVRIEEMLNFFPFRYSAPKGDAPFAASMEVADAPWQPAHRLVRIGLKAREVQAAARPPITLMFVVDVVDVDRLSSRLPMIKGAITSLLGKLQAGDRVGLVSCRDQSSVVLAPTPVAQSPAILAALDQLSPGGMTSRMKGIQRAYETIEADAIARDNARVILCTDGNASLTITAEGPFARFLEGKKKSGVGFTAFAFGMGIYHDSLVDFMSDYGAGNWAYIDSRRDAEKLLAEDVNGPPITVAKNVAIEVAFNPAKVARYRLIGYDHRELKRDDFKGDLFDSDEVGAGHAVTALFEIEPAPETAAATPPAFDPNELLAMKVRYKKPGGALKRMLDFPLFDSRKRFVDASADFKFAAAVAGLGMILRDSPHKGATTLTQVIQWASDAAQGDDPGGYRSEFVELAREAEKLER